MKTLNLDNLTILVTRPKPQGEALCAYLKAYGAKCVFFPTIEIVRVDPEIKNIAGQDWLIFMSPQAVYHGGSIIRTQYPTFTGKIAAIGEGTRDALQQAHLFVDTYPDDWRSEGLLNLPQFKAVAGKKITIIQGQGGRELLAEILISRGADVTSMIVYQRTRPKVDISEYLNLVRNQEIDSVICTSNAGLQNLKILLATVWEDLCKIPFVVVSDRIFKCAEMLGCKKIFLAKNASHPAILATLVEKKGELCKTKPTHP